MQSCGINAQDCILKISLLILPPFCKEKGQEVDLDANQDAAKEIFLKEKRSVAAD